MMGLLQDLAGQVLGGALGGADDDDDVKKKGVKLDPATAMKFVQGAVAVVSAIGLPKIISMFKKAGLGDKIKSWVSTGKNEKVTGEEVETALGPDIVGQLAKKTGLDTAGAAAGLAKYLPTVIDALTPDGKPKSKTVAKETSGFDLGDLAGIAGSLMGGKASGGLGGLFGAFMKK